MPANVEARVEFSRKELEGGFVEIRIVLPPLPDQTSFEKDAHLKKLQAEFRRPFRLRGLDARNAITAWVLAYASGIALRCGWSYLESQIRDLSDAIDESQGGHGRAH